MDTPSARQVTLGTGERLPYDRLIIHQGRVAGRNALGAGEEVQPKPIPMLVKGIGIHLVSAGRIGAQPGDEVLVRDVPDLPSYTRLVVSHADGRSASSRAEGRVAGAVVPGVPDEAPDLLAAVERSAPIGEVAALRSGSWQPVASWCNPRLGLAVSSGGARARREVG